jgi:hypothetical protein
LFPADCRMGLQPLDVSGEWVRAYVGR